MNALIEYQAGVDTLEDYDAFTDEELLLAYRADENREAFEKLVGRYECELFNYLRHYLGDAEMAEDVFQTTFFQVHNKCELFEEGRAFRPWLYRIATNQAIDAKRRNKRHAAVSLDAQMGGDENSWNVYAAQLTTDEVDPDENLIDMERSIQVREAVEQLPDMLRQVLYLVYFQGMKYREAAETLGIPFGTIKSRLNIAIKKLQFVLAKAV
jgi:RNA polymerase sigma factor, sigma-70 family